MPGPIIEFIRNKNKVPCLLFILLAVSVLVRIPFLNRPISEHHEWLTSTSLRHIQIFYENGASRFHFSPTMTFGNQADKNICYDPVLRDKDGNCYYLSFPPFAFIFPYLVFKALHIYPTILALQLFNVFFHFVSCFFVYLIIRILTDRYYRDKTNIPAVIGFAVYLFSPAPLWFQSNVYMSDMFIQPFFIIGAYLFLKYVRSERKWPYIILLALISMVMIYTEWLGVLFAFSVCLYALRYFKQRGNIPLILVLTLATAATLLFIVWQYSQIAGMNSYLDYAYNKFNFRSGNPNHASDGMSFFNIISWLDIIVNYIGGFLPFLVFPGLMISGSKSLKSETKKFDSLEWAALYITFLPCLLHHLVLFNFTAIHDFSALKGGVFIAILSALLYHNVAQMTEDNLPYKKTLAGVILFALLQFILINSYGVSDRYKRIGEEIRRTAQDDEVVFARADNFVRYPQYLIYAHRNISGWDGEEEAKRLIRKNGMRKGILFTIDTKKGLIEKVEHITLDDTK